MGFWIKTLKNIKHRFYANYECFNGKVTKNDFIKEKQVTEATGNLTQLKQEKKQNNGYCQNTTNRCSALYIAFVFYIM